MIKGKIIASIIKGEYVVNYIYIHNDVFEIFEKSKETRKVDDIVDVLIVKGKNNIYLSIAK